MARSRPVGVDIGSTAVRVVSCTDVNDSGYVQVERAAVVTLPAHAVVAGRVRDKLAVAAAVNLAVRQAGLRGRQAVIGLASTRATVERMSVPASSPSEDVDAMLRSTANQLAAASFEEVACTAQLVGTEERAGTIVHDLVVSTIPAVDVRVAKEIASLADLQPVAADLSAAAAVRAMLRRDPDDPSTIMVVDIGSDLTSAATVTGPHLSSLVSVPGGGDDVTLTLGRFLGVDPSVAEVRKRFLTLNTAPALKAVAVSEYDDVATVTEIAHQTPAEEAMASSVEVLIDQVVELVVSTRPEPVELVLTGGSSRIQGLSSRLGVRAQIPARAGRPWATLGKKVETDGRDPDELLDDLTVAIGLSMLRPG